MDDKDMIEPLIHAWQAACPHLRVVPDGDRARCLDCWALLPARFANADRVPDTEQQMK